MTMERMNSREGQTEMRDEVDTLAVVNLTRRISEISTQMAELQAAATDGNSSEQEREEAHQKVMRLGEELAKLDTQRARAEARLQ